MSYDISIGDEWFNYTYNCSTMFQLAFDDEEGIYVLDNCTGKCAASFLRNAIDYFHENAKTLEKLNPTNGWGSYDSALAFLISLREECLRNTRKRVHVT
jgi:hypothetical protein